MACTCGNCTSTTILCSQVSIPTVDNTVPDCADIYYEQCIIMTTERTAPINIAINDNLQETIDKLLLHIIAQDARIAVLEAYNISNP